MFSFSKIALTVCFTILATGVHAELTVLNDDVMGQLTGQSGLSIGLEANVSIGEVAYKDGGFITMEGGKLGGAGVAGVSGAETALDNMTIDMDVAGPAGNGVSTNYGIAGVINQLIDDYDAGEGNAPGTSALSDVISALNASPQNAKDVYLLSGHEHYNNTPDGNEATHLSTLLESSVGANDGAIEDGDLVIHISATDMWDEVADMRRDVDFGLHLDQVALRPSTYLVGERGTANTVLMSDVNLAGSVGPVDIIIDESTSKLAINAYFAVDGGNNSFGGALSFGEFNAMTFDFINVSIGRFWMLNAKGKHLGYAHAAVVLSASNKGLLIDVKDFSADIGMGGITIGANSIGDVYITDLQVTATMDVYGH